MQTKDINFFVQFSTRGAVFPQLQNLKTYRNSVKLTKTFSTCFSHSLIYFGCSRFFAFVLFRFFHKQQFHINTSNVSSKDDQTIPNFFPQKKKGRKRENKNWVKTLTFKTSHTVTLSSESLVITCLLFLKTWNFLMLGAPVYK